MRKIALTFVALAFLLNSAPSVSAAPSVSLVPSRTTGVAPLSVFFDATLTTDPAVTSKPFHELEYTWNFGDDDTVTWSTGAHVGDGSIYSKKNRASGPVSAHVYETPGTYTVTLSVFDGITTSTQTQTITVQDPNVVFSGANTICVSASGNFSGCPSGATATTTSAFDIALATYKGTGKRILFHKGETFTTSSASIISNVGPMTVGAYGSGAKPIINEVPADSILVFDLTTSANDLRIMDLDIEGGGTNTVGTGYGIAVEGDIDTTLDKLTVLRLTISHTHAGIIMTGDAGISQSVIQDSTIDHMNGSGSVGIYGKATYSAYLGNYVGPFYPSAEHNIRLQPGYKVAVSNNTGTTPGTSGKEVLTIRAKEHTPDAIDPNPHNLTDTQYIEVSDNHFIGNGATQVMDVAPASTGQNNWLYDVIVERNWLETGPNTASVFGTLSVRTTVRNNICNVTGSGLMYRNCFSVGSYNYAGAPNPDSVNFYNNTCYSGDSSSVSNGPNFGCVSLDGTDHPMTNSIVKNNIAYAPTAFQPKSIASYGTVTGTIGASGTFGNSSDAQMSGTNPLFSNSSGAFSLASDFTLTSSSYGAGSGVSIPSFFSDFFGTKRSTSIFDMGAVAYNTLSSTPTPQPLTGDLNSDHIVNALDWSLMNAKWFTNDTTADLNRDGVVNAIDFSLLNANWFKTW